MVEYIMPYLFWGLLIIPALVVIFLLIILIRASSMSEKRGRRKLTPAVPTYDLSGRAAESLSEVIRFKTVSSPAGGTPSYFSALLRLKDYLKSRYPLIHETMELEIIAEYSLVFRWKGRTETLDPYLFCAHMDVVPAEGVWERDPFSGEIAGNYVHGRGALDCKNIMICLLETAESLIESGFIPARDMYFAFGHDEEVGGETGAKNIAKYFAEKNLRFEMVLDEGGALQQGYMGLKRPVASVGVTEKGFMTIKLTARSPGGHSSTPPRHSALGMISEAVSRAEYRPMKAKLLPVVREQLIRLAPFLPPKTRLLAANLWCFKGRLLKKMAADNHYNALIRTTLAATMASAGTAPNVLPQTAEVILNLRPIHGDSCRHLTEFISELVKGLGVEVEVLREDDASNISSFRSAAFKRLEGAITDFFGDVIVIPGVMTGGTDSRKYEGLCDNIYRFCPFLMTAADSAKVHAANESVRIDYLGAAIEFYRGLFTRE